MPTFASSLNPLGRGLTGLLQSFPHPSRRVTRPQPFPQSHSPILPRTQHSGPPLHRSTPNHPAFSHRHILPSQSSAQVMSPRRPLSPPTWPSHISSPSSPHPMRLSEGPSTEASPSSIQTWRLTRRLDQRRIKLRSHPGRFLRSDLEREWRRSHSSAMLE
jgi:hypothetical protein